MALSAYGSPGDTSGSSPQTRQYGTAVALNDLMLTKVITGVPTTPVLADNVSSGGNWPQVSGTEQFDSTTSLYFWWFSKVMNVTSATLPTVACTSAGVFFEQFNIIAITGFLGTPSFDATNTNLQSGTGGTANTVQSTTQSGEILLAQWASQSSFFTGQPSGWSQWPPSSAWTSSLIGPEPSGTNCNASNAQNASSYWVQSLIGVYDATSLIVPLVWIT